jgi:hypothetical protein
MSEQKIAACLQILIFFSTAALTAGETEQEDKRGHSNAVIIHSDYHSFSSTPPRIPNATDTNDDEDKKSTSSQKIQEESVLLIHNGQDEDWFSEVRQLSDDARKISTELIEIREKEIKAHEALYTRILATVLPYFPTSVPPQRFTRMRLVTEPSSYQILIDSFDGFVRTTNRLPRLTNNPIDRVTKYGMHMPIFNASQAGNLSSRAPHSFEDACGQIIENLGHFTSFAHARREEMKRILRRIKYGVVLASFVGTTAYFIWLEKTQQSQESISDDYWINLAAHIIAWPALEYPISMVYHHQNRNDTRKVDRTIIENIPYIADVEPMVNHLVRTYAAKNLKQGIDTLNSQRNLCCWLLCCPLISRVRQILKLPLRNVSEIERINTLLEGSYSKLQTKLRQEDEISNVEAEAARRICTKYDDILTTMYTLNQNNLDDIVRKTKKPELTLSYRGRNTLLGIMARSRKQLTNCMPAHIRNKAQVQQ